MHGFRNDQTQAKKPESGGGLDDRFHPLSSIEIEEKCKNIPGFIGVLLKNDLRKLTPKHCAVINIDHVDDSGSPERGGTHWVAYYKGSYFDSFGGPPVSELDGKVKVYNSTIYQNPDDVSCGYWCILFLKLMDKHNDFAQVMVKMSRVKPEHLLNIMK